MLDFILHLDQHLAALVGSLGPWSIAILFLVVFCETGLVVTPFLPGDSLLFAVGTVSALHPEHLPIGWVFFSLFLAAVLGDSVNAELGRRAGGKLSSWVDRRPGGAKHLDAARMFFNTHGGRAVIFARFLPLLRTFVPFVAGIAGMKRVRFFWFNAAGALLWVGGLTLLGYSFGNLPAVKSRFHLVIMGIIVVSMTPLALELLRAMRKPSKAPSVP